LEIFWLNSGQYFATFSVILINKMSVHVCMFMCVAGAGYPGEGASEEPGDGGPVVGGRTTGEPSGHEEHRTEPHG